MRGVSVLLGFVLLGCSAAMAETSPTETWPTKPVRILASAAPGGGVDLVARILAQALTDALNQNFLVENSWRGGRDARHKSGREERAGWLHAPGLLEW